MDQNGCIETWSPHPKPAPPALASIWTTIRSAAKDSPVRNFGIWLKNRNIEEGWKEGGTAPRPSPRPPSARETRSLREEGEVSAPHPPRTPSQAKPCGPSGTQARTHPVPVPPVAPGGILVPRLSALSAPLGPKAPGGFHSSRLPRAPKSPGPQPTRAPAGPRGPGWLPRTQATSKTSGSGKLQGLQALRCLLEQQAPGQSPWHQALTGSRESRPRLTSVSAGSSGPRRLRFLGLRLRTSPSSTAAANPGLRLPSACSLRRLPQHQALASSGNWGSAHQGTCQLPQPQVGGSCCPGSQRAH